MYTSRRSVQYFIGLLFLFSVISHGQEVYFVANTDSHEATAYNNSHKIALNFGECLNDTINVVFQSSDSIYVVFTTNGGQTWSTPAPVGQGKFPAIDINLFGHRHVAWQSLDNDIYYDCLDDWSPPVNVSQSPEQSVMPDLIADSNNVIHVVWSEQIDRHNQIYYRTVSSGIPGDTIRISGYGSTAATYTHPSISMFHPNDRIYIVWECYDSLSYSPYQIHLCYKEGNSWSPTTVWAHYLAMRHPSIDYSHGEEQDTLSFCYEDSTSGSMQATFYGGNGGGYQTQGYSTYPVVSTVGPTWSYLFWQEDSAGSTDIYYDLYYFNSGWNHGLLNFPESVRYPNVCGAYAVWTQGDSIPYSIYFADFGYPIGIRENERSPMPTIAATPNPFNGITRLTLTTPTTKTKSQVKVYDSSGRLVKTLHLESGMSGIGLPGKNQESSVVWRGDDNAGKELPAGVYWCYLAETNQRLAMKVIKVE